MPQKKKSRAKATGMKNMNKNQDKNNSPSIANYGARKRDENSLPTTSTEARKFTTIFNKPFPMEHLSSNFNAQGSKKKKMKRKKKNNSGLSFGCAGYIIRRLPTELHYEIYKYTLVCETPVEIKGGGKQDVEHERRPYQWHQNSKVADQELRRAMRFHIWSDLAVDSYGAHAFFLGHNTFSIRDRIGANTLVDTVQRLEQQGFGARVHGIEVNVLPDINYDYQLKCAHDSFEQDPRLDPDFEKTDGRCAGLRGFRILKPLLKLSKLQNLHIIVGGDTYDEDAVFSGIGDENPGLQMLAAVVARLKTLVLDSPNAPKFKVTGKDLFEGDEDITWLWEPLSEAETKRMKHLEEQLRRSDEASARINARLEDIQQTILDQGSLKRQGRTYDSSLLAKLEQERKRLGSECLDLHETTWSSNGFKDELDTLLDRKSVTEMAADPDWEEEVETIAKQASMPYSDEDEDASWFI